MLKFMLLKISCRSVNFRLTKIETLGLEERSSEWHLGFFPGVIKLRLQEIVGEIVHMGVFNLNME